jgi:hypothetical protein
MARLNELRPLETGKINKSAAPLLQAPLEAYRVENPRSFIDAERPRGEPLSLLLDSRQSLAHFERVSMQAVTVEFLFGRVGRLSRIHLNETKAL